MAQEAAAQAAQPEQILAKVAEVQSQAVEVVGFGNKASFELMQRMAVMLAASALVPENFRGSANIPNVVIALEMANRIGASPLAVMQNLYIVHGKPGWSSQFIIAAVNNTGRYTPLRFAVTGEGEAKTCVAWAIEKATGERLESPPVSIEMAKKEGWLDKSGSKWKTMPDLMLRYRSATFFGRLYAPEVLMGMKTVEEVIDVTDPEVVAERLEPGKGIAGLKAVLIPEKEADPEKKPESAPPSPSGAAAEAGPVAGGASSAPVQTEAQGTLLTGAGKAPDGEAFAEEGYRGPKPNDTTELLQYLGRCKSDIEVEGLWSVAASVLEKAAKPVRTAMENEKKQRLAALAKGGK